MKKMSLILLLALIALLVGACNKTEAPKNTNTTAAKPANTNTAPTTTPTPTAAKAPVKPVSTDSGGNVYTHPAGGIQFEAPASWKAEADGEVMTLSTADGSLSVTFWVPKEGTLNEALNALDEELGKVMKNIKQTDEPEKSSLNGMPTYSVAGTGTVDNAPVEWGAHLFEAKRPVIALSFAAPGAYEKYEKEIEAFVKTIKKTS